MLDAIFESDHNLTASERGRLWSTTMLCKWAYERGGVERSAVYHNQCVRR